MVEFGRQGPGIGGGLLATARALAQQACLFVGLDGGDLQPMRVHSNAVFLAVRARVVVRVGGGEDAIGRAERSVKVAGWLAGLGFPTVVPCHLDQPVFLGDDVAVTFWDFVPSADEPVTATELGRLVRVLHRLPPPPFELRSFQPLQRLVAVARQSPWLTEDDRVWLLARAADLQQSLASTASSLGPAGLVHGDAQLGNALSARVNGAKLADWDSVGWFPRPWDLVPVAVEPRFGGSPVLLEELLGEYGDDPRGAAGWQVLLDTYELRSVAAHIRRATASPPHAAEARLRIESLRRGDRSVRWHPVG